MQGFTVNVFVSSPIRAALLVLDVDQFASSPCCRLGGVRAISCSANMFASDADFEAAQGRVQTLKSRPDNQVMLQLYSLFKQVSFVRPKKK